MKKEYKYTINGTKYEVQIGDIADNKVTVCVNGDEYQVEMEPEPEPEPSPEPAPTPAPSPAPTPQPTATAAPQPSATSAPTTGPSAAARSNGSARTFFVVVMIASLLALVALGGYVFVMNRGGLEQARQTIKDFFDRSRKH